MNCSGTVRALRGGETVRALLALFVLRSEKTVRLLFELFAPGNCSRGGGISKYPPRTSHPRSKINRQVAEVGVETGAATIRPQNPTRPTRPAGDHRMTVMVDIRSRPGQRGYIVCVTPDGTGASASGRPLPTKPWEYGPFSTRWGARRRARTLSAQYAAADQPDRIIEVTT